MYALPTVTPGLYSPMPDAKTVAVAVTVSPARNDAADHVVLAQPRNLYFLKAALRTMTAEHAVDLQNHAAHVTGFVLALSATLLVLRLLP